MNNHSSRSSGSRRPSQRGSLLARQVPAGSRSSFSLVNIPDEGESNEFAELFVSDKITSEMYGPSCPPKDWADISLLIPHEALRREMTAMCASIDKLVQDGTTAQPWQILYFCEWFVDWFSPAVHDHHDNEEEIYFPWVATKAELPEKQFSRGHEELVSQLSVLEGLCEAVIDKDGKDCAEELQELKTKMHAFDKFMREHLQEEEQELPSLLRANFTKEDEDKIIQKIAGKDGLAGLRIFLPSVALAAQEWATPAFWEDFEKSLPPPIAHLFEQYVVPDHENCVVPKRDAPFLDEEPSLRRVKCCKIPVCCFPCVF